MKLFNRVAISVAVSVVVWPAFAADFYWSCTTSLGNRYADATRCDTGDVGVRIMKDGAAPAAGSASTVTKLSESSSSDADASSTSAACPKDPAVCKRPDYDVKAGTPRAQAITHFMRQKECEFLQRFPKRCELPN